MVATNGDGKGAVSSGRVAIEISGVSESSRHGAKRLVESYRRTWQWRRTRCPAAAAAAGGSAGLV